MKTGICFSALLLTFSMTMQAQDVPCKRWGNNPADSVKALESYNLFRDRVKLKQLDDAYPYWEATYALAPTGNEFMMIDGIEILKNKANKEADAAKKAELQQRVIKLYDQWMGCFGKEADITSRKAIDMSVFQMPAADVYKTFKRAADLYGDNVPYYLIGTYSYYAGYMYSQNQVSKEDMRNLYKKLNDIANSNIAANKEAANYKTYIDQANTYFNAATPPFFDCDYYVSQYQPTYKYEPTKENAQLRANIKAKLATGSCPETNAFMQTLVADDARWENDGVDLYGTFAQKASKAYKNGDFGNAASLFIKAAEDDPELTAEQKADYCYRAAHIAYDKLNSFSNARSYARKALQYRPNWGDPYMMIGDLYAASTRSCGDSFEGRMAISAAIDKYIQAKNVDPSAAAEANKRISKYSPHLPSKEEGFQRGIKEGQSWKVGCWIDESTVVRLSN